ncbi:MAG: hypothetical protein NC084_01220 [Bacteroides sp.]|nr:hypothetical protein [Eubacterium sp.]MCM1417873.1 hypothetical protein [Roseburia sp.]MCM1461312.1 hypothetical protein [Bacteroides sp.]
MKKYLKVLPMILYPYAYLIFFVFVYSVGRLDKEGADWIGVYSEFGLIAAVLYNVWVLILALWSAIGGLKRHTPADAAKMSLAVKGWQIPAYLFNFLLGGLGLLANIWGIGFIALAVTVDLLTIALSGLFAVGTVRRLKKEGLLSRGTAILAGIGSFVYCVDVVVAIALVVAAKKRAIGEKATTVPPPPILRDRAPSQKEKENEEAEKTE